MKRHEHGDVGGSRRQAKRRASVETIVRAHASS
jgi:hypothetical protein